MADFESKIAIITGGTSGIGLQCSKELLSKGLKKLAVLDICVNHDGCRRLIAEFGNERVVFIKCDVSKVDEMENSFKIVMERFGSLDIVINNAGILDDANWEKELLVNMNGTIRGTLLGLKYMSKAEGGSGGTILNVSSVSGLLPMACCPVYSAASCGIIGFTRAFALPYNYSKSNVRMMTICPGNTYTKILSGASKKMLNDDMGREWLKLLSMIPTQKMENVANGITYMLQHGENGSVWVSDAGQPVYEIEMPQTNELQKKSLLIPK